jgi:hypothetical protein
MVILVVVRGVDRLHGAEPKAAVKFQTSDRCVACHNQLTTDSGKDVSIGFDWRSSIMGNSSRDPYWQGSVRRETIDHPSAKAHIEDECSICHMPITRYEAKLKQQQGQIFSHLPFDKDKKDNAKAEDGVSCSVCHQIGKEKLGTRESFNGGFVIDAPESKDNHPEYGPFNIQNGQAGIMDSSSDGFRPTEASQIRDSALCGTCHTLQTTALDKNGKELGEFPEQMPYQEWLHSDYRESRSCQSCHMPEVGEPAPIAAVLGVKREGVHQHVFVGGNFFMQNLLNRYRGDLAVTALAQELTNAANGTMEFLRTQAAKVSVRSLEVSGSVLQVEVLVENLTGHKLPTAYPSRRAWLHVLVNDANGKAVFESGALNRDGSIQGNDNDADPLRFEPHYSQITSPEQVEIYEPILKDDDGRVTTGLLSTVGYLKDDRLLPHGFNKESADSEIAVVGEAAQDANFTEGGDLIKYAVPIGSASGPFRVKVELWYQPIGFRWAHNLGAYKEVEPQRFLGYYESMSGSNAVVLATTETTK